jgi:hypothetical protein
MASTTEDPLTHCLLTSVESKNETGGKHALTVTFADLVVLGDETVLQEKSAGSFRSASDFRVSFFQGGALLPNFRMRTGGDVRTGFDLLHAGIKTRLAADFKTIPGP